MTSYSDMLSDNLNVFTFPYGTDIVVLPLDPREEIIKEYILIYYRRFHSTQTHRYRIKKVYLVKYKTYYYDDLSIVKLIRNCIKNTWKQYNTEGNKMYAMETIYTKDSEVAIIEYEELDLIYEKPYKEPETMYVEDGTIMSYDLYYKESIELYFGNAKIMYNNEELDVNMEYKKTKPSEEQYQKDIITKFCEDYNVILYEDEEG